jgi:Flp pilus assembly protein TadG
MRFPRKTASERGATAIHLAVILVPVVFGLLGFALDLGILYSVKGELRTAATAMALAAAQQLNGTDASTGAAAAAAQLTIETASGFGNRYYFHGLPVGQTNGQLTSTVSDPQYYSTAAAAIANAGGETGGSLAKYVRVTVTGQTQLLFWSFLPLAADRNLPIMATAVAGISAPLCQACGIEPMAVQAVDASDGVNFGYTPGTKYSMAYLCNGASPAILPGAAQSVPYLLLNRLDTAATQFSDESTQMYRATAAGLPGNANNAIACFRINNAEVIWATATVNQCTANMVQPIVTVALCGLDTRFEATPSQCTGIPGVDTLADAYPPDTDLADYDTYPDYTGNGRRIITIPVVDTLSATANMTVLGFRQFLLIPNQGGTNIAPADVFGRFIAMYIGSVVPLKQGSFSGCQVSAGPGKVVLHQ